MEKMSVTTVHDISGWTNFHILTPMGKKIIVSSNEIDKDIMIEVHNYQSENLKKAFFKLGTLEIPFTWNDEARMALIKGDTLGVLKLLAQK